MCRSNTLFSCALMLASLAFTADVSAQARIFKIDSQGGSSIQFVSDAPLEKFGGKSTSVSGELRVDPDQTAATKGDIKVEVATIRTNLALRDEYLAGENWLDAKKYPQARFVIMRVTGPAKLVPNAVAELTVNGKFSLHGVTKDVIAKLKVRYTPGAVAAVRAQGSFTIHLQDYMVLIPASMNAKVAPDILVNIDLRANAS